MPNIIRTGGGTVNAIPDGATVTPVDAYATWLACAGIANTFGSLSAVIADATAKATLCNNLNALRYMVRSTATIMPAVLANSGWVTALDGSTYSKVTPTFASDSTADGVCSASTAYAGSPAWRALDGDWTNAYVWQTTTGSIPQWWKCILTSAFSYVYKIESKAGSTGSPGTTATFTYQLSSDGGTTWNTVTSATTRHATEPDVLNTYQITANNNDVDSIKLLFSAIQSTYAGILEVKMYGLDLA